MIDFNNAIKEFKTYISEYDINNISTQSKITHTYHVMSDSEKIANALNLNNADVELAKLIGLLHDIGRFDEIKILGQMDASKFNHAEHGVEILFNNDFIRKFISTNEFDEIIKFSILNHNKFEIEKTNDDRKLLFAKIIRDADKLDNFRVKSTNDKLSMSPKLIDSVLEQDVISEDVLKTFYSKSTILTSDRKTALDIWISYLAFIFDFNYKYPVEIIKEKGYIDTIIDRIDYKNLNTKYEIEKIRLFIHNYIEEFIENNE